LSGKIGQKIMSKHKDKELREDGWMTVDEFMAQLTPGLTEYLHENWGIKGKEALHHPTDLFTNASVYMDIAYRISNDFINCKHG
jgi:hypothetical protein